MRRALINAAGVIVNVIEIDEGADYPLPDGWRLDDPDKFPFSQESDGSWVAAVAKARDDTSDD